MIKLLVKAVLPPSWHPRVVRQQEALGAACRALVEPMAVAWQRCELILHAGCQPIVLVPGSTPPSEAAQILVRRDHLRVLDPSVLIVLRDRYRCTSANARFALFVRPGSPLAASADAAEVEDAVAVLAHRARSA